MTLRRLGYLQRRRAKRCLSKLPDKLELGFVGYGLPEESVEQISAWLDSLGPASETELSILLENLKERGAEEVALHVAETLEMPYAIRRKLAAQAYRSVDRHAEDAVEESDGAALAFLGITGLDMARKELYLARTARKYELEVDVQAHAERARSEYRLSPYLKEEVRTRTLERITNEFCLDAK